MKLSPILKIFPGKSSSDGSFWLPFWVHSMDTAEIMIRLLDDWLPGHVNAIGGLEECESRKLCRFLALTHDIGKLTPVFAARITEVQPEIRQRLEASGLRIDSPDSFLFAKCSPHAKAGEAILLHLNCPPGIAAVIGAHHGKPQESRLTCEEDPDIYAQNYFGDSASKDIWDKLRREWFAAALDYAGYQAPEGLPEISQPMQVLLSGLVIMADWIASNNTYFPLIPIDSCGDQSFYPKRADYAWGMLGLPESWTPECFVMDSEHFSEVFGFPPNPVQIMMMQAANEGSGGIYILEAQMGVGKTEAALAAAETLASKSSCGGIFFGLPTQATTNGLFCRLTKWAETQAEDTQLSIRLAHAMAALNDDYKNLFHGTADGNEDSAEGERLIVHPWFNGHKQALLANFVIGTVDQLLMAALKQKHVMLRHLGLAGKVVILDECHAYDAYMNQYLDRTLNWLGAYQIPVIVLSATLPEQRRAELVEAYLNAAPEETSQKWRTQRAYPLLTWTTGRAVRQTALDLHGVSRTVAVSDLSSSNLISELRELVLVGGCCGIIVNTVRMAQSLAKLVSDSIPEADILLLHSRYVATDRAMIEEALLGRIGKQSTPEERRGLIVIGTQVLEQSLDIDFDLLITQLCPMDLLLQRIGRLHRHARVRPASLSSARCFILDLHEASDDGSRFIYGDWLLQRTRELLPETITLPQSIPILVQNTYQKPSETDLQDSEHREAWDAFETKIKTKKQKAESYRIEAPKKPEARRKRTIDGWLNTSYPADGVYGDAAVRDGESSITVLVMQEHADGNIGFLPWQQGGQNVSSTHMPDEETARRIAGQRLTLPLVFSAYGREDRTIRELEELNRRRLPEWQNSGWLSGELILLFDDHLQAELCGHNLYYSKEYGLTWEREDDSNDHQL